MEQSSVCAPRNAALTGYVESIWTLRGSDKPSPYLLPPDASFTCVFSFDSDTSVQNAHNARSSIRGDFLTGMRTRPVTLLPSGPIDYVSVQFKPLGFHALFGLHANQVADEFVDLRFVSREVSRQRSRLFDDQLAPEIRQDVIERLLLSRIQPGLFTPPRYLSRAIECIQAAHGDIRVGQLCNGIGITSRQLQREFQRWIGVSVKFFARVVRMNRALELLQLSKRTDLAALAVSVGYYDQAHLCGDFAELVGLAPSQIVCMDID
jgi:AraC-like DNA-binding protein